MTNTVLIGDVEYMPVISVDKKGNVVTNRNGDTASNTLAETSSTIANDHFKNNALLETLVPVAAFNVAGLDVLSLKINVEDNALDQFEIHVQRADKDEWEDLGLANADYSTPNYPVINSDITNIASIATGSHILELNVSAYYRVMIKSASGNAALSKLEIFTGKPKPLPRIAINLVNQDENNVANSTITELGGGTVTTDSATGLITCESAGVGTERAFITITKTTIVNEYYAISFDVEELTGAPASVIMSVLVVTSDEGVKSVSTAVVGSRFMAIFRASNAVSAQYRIGLGLSTGETNAVTFSFKNVMVESLGENASHVSEYVPAGHTIPFNNAKANYWDMSNNTFVEGEKIPYGGNDFYPMFYIGDSFTNQAFEFPTQVIDKLGNGTANIYGVSGEKLIDMAANINDYFTNGVPVNLVNISGDISFLIPSDSVLPTIGVIQGGLNDVDGNNSATATVVPEMLVAFKTIVAKLRSEGLTPMALNMTPFGSGASFDLALNDNMNTVAWNANLLDYCLAENIPYVDIHALLRDPADNTIILAAYTSDGYHPNATGHEIIANAILLERFKLV